ncbi:hypothetical protein ASPCAL00382 [Aspergillus calidoustus]|uniref:F-box domain-containing protein n=1 Tax=Aspergillus calidoustus TaxID=454130 RepID=A0A0U5FMU8_ASPCI|nr:hypothetical protein ASPCAL00382 [Aspergillus calidoustus]
MDDETFGRVFCTLCSTTFNIARVRTLDEAEDASWPTYGPGANSWPTGEPQLWPCSTKNTGCMFYVGHRLLNSEFCREDQPPEIYCHHFIEWPKDALPEKGDWLSFDPNTKPAPGRVAIYLEDIEHVAGPGCRFPGAFSGNQITVEEMRGCQTVQCLVPKVDDWEPAVDDHDFEKDSKYFLSGIATRACSRVEAISANPVRHEIDEIEARCPVIDEFDVDYDHLPFHPWCFGTWIQLTKLRLGAVVVDGLVEFFRDLNAQSIQPLCHHFRVLSCNTYAHNPGDEYLAANPFYVPRLRDFLVEAMNVSSLFTPHDSPFCNSAISSTSSDVFACLSADLRLLILQHLAASEIASLRQASRTFYHLPVSLWYRLLREEMPWLWELWTDDAPYFWATVTERTSEITRQVDISPIHLTVAP